jgi:hypothetical protein
MKSIEDQSEYIKRPEEYWEMSGPTDLARP